MSPRQVYRLPANLSFDKGSGRYRYRNPLTGERFWLGRDRLEAIAKANRYNETVRRLRSTKEANAGAPTVSSIIDKYITNVVPLKPWDDGTRKNHMWALELYKREFADAMFPVLDRTRIAAWLRSRSESGAVYNVHRARWIDIYRYAISIGVVDYNEAEATLKMSTSKKLEANRKRRKRLTVEQFWKIHEKAPGWMQIAMETSLVTLQARAEVCNMVRGALRDGWLFVIRDKTAADSDMAFIRIEVTEQIEAIWSRAWSDSVPCPYLVHRRPKSQRPQHLANKPHPFYVEPAFLTKRFRALRDESKLFDHLEPGQRPTFHEIRSLGARIYRHTGWSHEQIRALMTHTHARTTTIYLENPGALTDDDFIPVKATMDLKSLPSI